MNTNPEQINTNAGNSELLQKDLFFAIQGSVYNAANKYGKGLKEKIYQKALELVNFSTLAYVLKNQFIQMIGSLS